MNAKENSLPRLLESLDETRVKWRLEKLIPLLHHLFKRDFFSRKTTAAKNKLRSSSSFVFTANFFSQNSQKNQSFFPEKWETRQIPSRFYSLSLSLPSPSYSSASFFPWTVHDFWENINSRERREKDIKTFSRTLFWEPSLLALSSSMSRFYLNLGHPSHTVCCLSLKVSLWPKRGTAYSLMTWSCSDPWSLISSQL
jgi:hypothetical protein